MHLFIVIILIVIAALVVGGMIYSHCYNKRIENAVNNYYASLTEEDKIEASKSHPAYPVFTDSMQDLLK